MKMLTVFLFFLLSLTTAGQVKKNPESSNGFSVHDAFVVTLRPGRAHV
jgi:hypothetical protein